VGEHRRRAPALTAPTSSIFSSFLRFKETRGLLFCWREMFAAVAPAPSSVPSATSVAPFSFHFRPDGSQLLAGGVVKRPLRTGICRTQAGPGRLAPASQANPQVDAWRFCFVRPGAEGAVFLRTAISSRLGRRKLDLCGRWGRPSPRFRLEEQSGLLPRPWADSGPHPQRDPRGCRRCTGRATVGGVW